MKRLIKILVGICIVVGLFNLCLLLIQRVAVKSDHTSEFSNMENGCTYMILIRIESI